MRRLALLTGLLLLACAAGDPNDLVIYKAPLTPVDGRTRERTLLVTGGGTALGLEKYIGTPEASECIVRTGEITGEEWTALKARVATGRSLVRNTVPPDSLSSPFQLYARFGAITIELVRDPEAEVEEDVGAAKSELERIWGGLARSADPVAVLTPLLAAPSSHVRGQAVLALLSLRRAGRTTLEVKKAATTALGQHLANEPDPQIRQRIEAEFQSEGR